MATRDVPHTRPVYWLLETVRERSVTARVRDIIVHWRISLFRAEQTMLAEIVLAAPESPRRNILLKNWIKITGHAAMLGFETQQVMHLRMMKLFAGGPEAQSEALRMVTEKTSALAEATMTLARGGSAQRVIRRYRTHVRSNHRRLSKP
jgi:hypothetical protein